ncbi:succinate dehydrogenase, hydrophobic membrane anchor protein [Agrobacterium rosae]
MKTPLGRVRGLGSAKGGTKTYVNKQLSGLIAGLLTPYMIVLAIWLFGKPRDFVIQKLQSFWVAPFVLAFLLISIIHMRIGMQAIIEDYVHKEPLKTVLFLGNWLFSWGIGIIAILALLKIFLVHQ